jgi:hypothetical protein
MTNFNSKPKKSNTVLIIVTAIILLISLTSVGYVYNKSILEKKIIEKKLDLEKKIILSNLRVVSDSLDLAIASNATLSGELIVEKFKVEHMITDIEKHKGDIDILFKYKEEAIRLRKKIILLIKEIKSLKIQNSIITTQKDSIKINFEKEKELLIASNYQLNKTIKKAEQLVILNLESKSLKENSSGKKIVVDKASKVNLINISFVIAENKIIKEQSKDYYIQIIDSQNNVMCEPKTKDFGVEILVYSYIANVFYQNKTIKISKNIPVTDIQAGTYFVNVFDKAELVSKTSFVLK